MKKPEILSCSFSRESLISDLSAGVVLGFVALPLAIAFAIASGVKPEQGLYTAIIAGFIVTLLGEADFRLLVQLAHSSLLFMELYLLMDIRGSR
jgi:SulP family sulfate permease